MFLNYDSVVADTICFIKCLQVKVTARTVDSELQSHPDYPSLLSISDCLSKWNIDNAAFKVEPAELANLPVPFLARVGTGKFVTVNKIENEKVYYTDRKKTIASYSSFSKLYKGIVLLAQTTAQSGEKEYLKNKQKATLRLLKTPALILTIIAFVLLSSNALFSLSTLSPAAILAGFIALFILKVAGLSIAGILLWYDIDKSNSTLQKFCTFGKKTNCNAILNSKAAKIAGVSWSEIGFFYFSGGLLFLSIGAGAAVIEKLQLITTLNFFALPYICFSIYYQWHIIRQWCPLCLAIQAILLLEFVTAISTATFHPFAVLSSLTLSSAILFLTAFTLPIITWIAIKPLLQKIQKGKQDFYSLQRFKFNNEIFSVLLEKQKKVGAPPEGLGITLGNPNAQHTLIKVCNPYCGPCAQAHPQIDRLLERNHNLKVQIVFVSPADENDPVSLPIKHFLAIADTHDELIIKQALDDWYLAGKKEYARFAEKYPVNGKLKEHDPRIKKMKEWCSKTEVTFTPAFFFNQSQLPAEYSIEDLEYFIL